jgi:hypothetical protein
LRRNKPGTHLPVGEKTQIANVFNNGWLRFVRPADLWYSYDPSRGLSSIRALSVKRLTGIFLCLERQTQENDSLVIGSPHVETTDKATATPIPQAVLGHEDIDTTGLYSPLVRTAQHESCVHPLHETSHLRLLLEPERAHRVFFHNLAELLWARSSTALTSSCSPGIFWQDVFVSLGVPWRRMLQSVLCHTIAVVALLILWQTPAKRTQQQQHTRKWNLAYYASSHSSPAGADRLPVSAPLTTEERRTATHEAAIHVVKERRSTSITPGNIKLIASLQPAVTVSNPLLPAMPPSAMGSLKVPPPAALSSVVSPPPDSGSIIARWPALPQNSIILPPPSIGQGDVSYGHGPTLPHAAVAPPTPEVQGVVRDAGEIDIGPVHIVSPAPQLSASDLPAGWRKAEMTNALSGVSIVPPPPHVQDSGIIEHRYATPDFRANPQGISPAPSVGVVVRQAEIDLGPAEVVGPAPRLSSNDRSAIWSKATITNGVPGASIVPPPPSFQDSEIAEHQHAISGSRAARQGVSRAPSDGVVGEQAEIDISSRNIVGPAPQLSASDQPAIWPKTAMTNGVPGGSIVPPPASFQGSEIIDRHPAEFGADPQGISRTPSVNVAGQAKSAQSEALMAMNTQPSTIPARSLPENRRGPDKEEFLVRFIAPALALPNSSYFSNYEVYVAERVIAKGEEELIKLIYMSLPYQPRLSEYGLNNTTVYKLRVSRDRSCDETLMQMTWPESNASPGGHNADQNPVLSPNGQNGVVPCYRTTADDYQRALSRRH